jgi:hypothetical protein
MNHVYWPEKVFSSRKIDLRTSKPPNVREKERKLVIINWEIKILNSMTSFIDATSSHTKDDDDDADEITNLRERD